MVNLRSGRDETCCSGETCVALTCRSRSRRMADPSQKPWKPSRVETKSESLRISRTCIVFQALCMDRREVNKTDTITATRFNLRLCRGSIKSAITTWSAFGIRCTFMSSARSRARLIKTFANALWSPFRWRSAINKGCSENLAPHAMTVATRLIASQRRVARSIIGASRHRKYVNRLTLGEVVFVAGTAPTVRRAGCCCFVYVVAAPPCSPSGCSATCFRSVIR